jgi:ATP-dependent Clp protease adaptor protein ClpS
MTEEKIKRNPRQDSGDDTSDNRTLVLHNDDVHTFEYVIEALIKICRHEYLQASQCASITHFNGKCDIRRGTYSELEVMKDALIIRELTVTIE